ncbi:unnamed protein product [Rhizopus stolonifer]
MSCNNYATHIVLMWFSLKFEKSTDYIFTKGAAYGCYRHSLRSRCQIPTLLQDIKASIKRMSCNNYATHIVLMWFSLKFEKSTDYIFTKGAAYGCYRHSLRSRCQIPTLLQDIKASIKRMSCNNYATHIVLMWFSLKFEKSTDYIFTKGAAYGCYRHSLRSRCQFLHYYKISKRIDTPK